MATEDRKVQIPVVVDATGAKEGFDVVKQGAKDMAQAVNQAGQQATRGVQAVAQASEKLTTTQARFVESVKRQAILASEGKAAFLEQKAAMLGVSDATSEYLAKIRQAEQGQANIGVSAKQMSAALRGVPAQFTDIVTSISSGQRPMQVLIQQGGQLKDMFGGVGPAARALGGYVAGLINPFTLAAAAVAGLAFAMSKAESSLREANSIATQLQATGRGADISREQIKALRIELEHLPGVTKDFAEAAISEFARTRQIGGQMFADLSKLVADYAAATGQTVPNAAKALAKAFEDPAAGAKQLEEQLGSLTAAQVITIQKLVEIGDRSGAQKVLFDALKESVKGLAEQGMTPLQKATNDLGNAWNDTMRSFDQSKGLQSANASLAQMLEYITSIVRVAREGGFVGAVIGSLSGGAAGFSKGGIPGMFVGQAMGAVNGWQGQAAPAQTGGATGSWDDPKKALDDQVKAVLAATSSYKSAAGAIDDMRTKAAKLTETLNALKAAGKGNSVEAQELADRLKGVNEKIRDAQNSLLSKANVGQSDIAGVRASKLIAQREAALLQQSIDSLDFSTPTKLTENEKKVIQVQEQLKTSLTAVARAAKEKELAEAQAAIQSDRNRQTLEKQYDAVKKAKDVTDQQIASIGDQADAIRAQAEAQEAANATFGKGKVAVEQYILAQDKIRAGEDGKRDDFYANMEQKIKAQERYVAALQAAESKALSLKNIELERTNRDDADLIQLEASLVGQTAESRAAIVASRKVELQYARLIAEVDRSGATDAEKEARRAELRAQQVVAQQNAVNRAVLDEWQKTSDQINQSLTDALLRGFESGKDFAENFRDTLKNMFKTLILRPVIQAVMAPVSGALAGFGQSIAGGGGVNGALSTASNLSSLYGAGSQFLFGGSAGASGASLAYANGVGMLGGDSLGALISANGGWAGVSAATGAAGLGFGVGAGGATAAGVLGGAGAATGADLALAYGGAEALGAAGTGAAAAGAGLSGALAAIPVAGWVLAAVALIAAMSKKGGPKADGTYGSGLGLGQGTHTAELDKAAKTAAAGLQGQYDSIVRSLGGTGGVNFGFGVSTDPKGDAPTMIEFNATRDGKTLFDNINKGVPRNEQELQQAIQTGTVDAIIGALKASDLPKEFKDFFDGIAADASTEVKSAALATAQAVSTYSKAVQDFGGAFTQIKDLSVSARDAMIQAAGGLDALAASTSSYIENFYSDEEKRAATVSGITRTLNAAGLQFTANDIAAATREQFRAWVDGLDLSTEAGRTAYVALMNVSGAFASITPAAESAADTISDAMKRLRSDTESLRVQYLRAVGNEPAANALQRQIDTAGMTAAEVAIYDYNQSIRAQIEAINTANQNLDTAKSNLLNGYSSESSALKQAIDAHRQYADSIRKERDSLLLGDLSPLSPDAMANAAKQQYDDVLAQALAKIDPNDHEAVRKQEEARSQYLSIAQQFLQSEQANAKTSADFNAVFLKVREDMRLLANTSDSQADVAQIQLDAMKAQLATLGLLKDVTQQGFAALLAAYNAAQAQAQATRAGGVSPTSLPPGVTPAAPGTVPAGLENGYVSPYTGQYYSPDQIAATQAASQNQVDISNAFLELLGRSPDLGARDYYSGWSEQAIIDAIKNSEEYAARAGIPRMSVGTNYLPQDMLVYAHEGEAIVPKAFNPAAGSAVQRDPELVAEIKALKAELQAIKANTGAISSNTERSAVALTASLTGQGALKVTS